ncbi:fatty acid desaturase family protein [Spirosoma montaniterrae]|uniref:fatty acid desaturase family protein n=1 Tax=Spirosoma montaniterrae TaxID=1178516 RepID=UPI00097D2F16|nr:acyl-CoA desaturase [Spirosoma montaniterrae]
MRTTTVKFLNKDKSTFFPILRERIEAYFVETAHSKQGAGGMVVKGLFMMALLLVPYGLIISNQFSLPAMLALVVLMGIGKAGVGMAVMHDANHGSFSSKNWVNNLFGASLFLIGGNVKNWKTQHNTLHHTYTNIHNVDEDITGKPWLRLCPSEVRKPYHRFQFIYAFGLYGLMTFSFLAKDFRLALSYNRQHASGNRTVTPFSRHDMGVLLISKLAYGLFIAGIPLLTTDLTFGQWLIGFFVLHFVAGLILSLVFQLAHIVEGANQPLPNESGSILNAWAIHQVQTTANFRCPRLLSWYIGGLDYQIEHHLFPTISHRHYPALSTIVRQTAIEHGIRYNQKPSFGAALQSHVQMLIDLGSDVSCHTTNSYPTSKLEKSLRRQ